MLYNLTESNFEQPFSFYILYCIALWSAIFVMYILLYNLTESTFINEFCMWYLLVYNLTESLLGQTFLDILFCIINSSVSQHFV